MEHFLLYLFYLLAIPAGDSKHEHEDLIRRAQKGDRNAFDDLVAILAPRLKAYMMKETPFFLDVEDVVLEAMVRLFTSIKSYRFESSITTFSFKLARRAMLNLIRNHPSRRGINTFSEIKVGDDEVDVIERMEIGDSAEDIVINKELKDQINAALGELSSDHRDVISLCLIQKFSHKEAADILGILENTVKTRLFRAKIEMQKKLKKIIENGNLFE